MKNSAGNLRHFLEGNGETRTLTREQARARSFIPKAEKENQRRFERNFVERQSGSQVEYPEHLLALKDGESKRLPIINETPNRERGAKGNEKKDADYYEFKRNDYSNLLHGELDEAFATGTSILRSRTKDGFEAWREGNLIYIEGIVEHRWDDTYDFHAGQPGAEPAHFLQQHGLAHVYENILMGCCWDQLSIDVGIVGSIRTRLPKRYSGGA